MNHVFGVEADAGSGSVVFVGSNHQQRINGSQCHSVYELVSGVHSACEGKVTDNVSRYGDDGTWSAVSIRVGTPPQWVDVMVSTLSSEIWVIGPGGCDNSEWKISLLQWEVLRESQGRRK